MYTMSVCVFMCFSEVCSQDSMKNLLFLLYTLVMNHCSSCAFAALWKAQYSASCFISLNSLLRHYCV
jgi:hypothetical protein